MLEKKPRQRSEIQIDDAQFQMFPIMSHLGHAGV
jgi:hypothetical protein